MHDDFNPSKLDDYPRVPHANEAGVQEGRGGVLPVKRYRSNPVVEIEESMANFTKRKKGLLPLIEGGIDDEDPALYDSGASISTVGRKMKVAQRAALTDTDVERIKSAADGEAASLGRRTGEMEEAQAVGVRGLTPDSGGLSVSVPQTSKKARRGQKSQSAQQLPVVERIVEKPVEKIVEKPVETEFSKWRSKRVRVEIATQDTTFNVSAIAAVRSIHGLVVFMPTTGDGMTFVPRAGANVKVRTKDLGIMDTVYTGVSFDLEELGVMGICFLVRNEPPVHAPLTRDAT